MVTLVRACFCVSVVVLVSLCFFAGASFCNAAIFISEFLPDPSDPGDHNEWIELYNSGNDPVSLVGYILDDMEGGSRPFLLDTYTIESESYLVLAKEVTKLSLNNDGDEIRLLLGDIVIDSVSYEIIPEDASYGRLIDMASWKVYSQPTMGHVNEVVPTQAKIALNDSVDDTVFLSEIMACPPTGDAEWVELVNTGSHSINLNDWHIVDEQQNSRSLSGTIHPHEYFYISWSGGFLNNSGDSVGLMDNLGLVRDKMTYQSCTKSLSFVNHEGAWQETTQVTKGSKNVFAQNPSPTSHIAKASAEDFPDKNLEDSTSDVMPSTVVMTPSLNSHRAIGASSQITPLAVGSVAGILDRSTLVASEASIASESMIVGESNLFTPLFFLVGFGSSAYGMYQLWYSWVNRKELEA